MLIKCDCCGKEFNKSLSEIKRTKSNFCSKECFKKKKQINNEEVECEECGKKFIKTSSRKNDTKRNFCSNECKFKNRNTQQIVKCAYCGKEHLKKLRDLKRNNNNFCSKECSSNFQDKKELKICVECGKQFYVSPSMAENRICCSNECKFENWKKKETSFRTKIKCDHCGKEILRLNSRISANENNFCSTKCAGEYKTVKEVVSYYDKREWFYLKNEALKRDGYKCTSCGKEDSKLLVHHIKPRKSGGLDELENLTTLCDLCHAKAHYDISESKKLKSFYSNVISGRYKKV